MLQKIHAEPGTDRIQNGWRHLTLVSNNFGSKKGAFVFLMPNANSMFHILKTNT